MTRRRRGRPVHGWLVLDKAQGMTSTQAVAAAKRLLQAAKAGHAGTLDPMATGVLPIAFGEATKTVSYAMDGRKTYRFTLSFGEARDTDDAEGQVVATSDVRPDEPSVRAVLPRFVGEIEQVPPRYSAVKIAGERAYDLAREGEDVVLAPRTIVIEELRLLGCPDHDRAEMEAVSGKGAYMRALARDIARSLGTVGHLSTLRRLNVGPFTLDDAISLEHLQHLVDRQEGESALLPLQTPLDDIPAVAVTDVEAHRMRSGQPVAMLRRSDRERIEALATDLADRDCVVLALARGTPVALARLDGAELWPVRILNLRA